MGQSLARKTRSADRAKYNAYLKSGAWQKRRRTYFAAVRASGFEPACQVCQKMLKDLGSLDLHHVSYDGVVKLPDGRFQSREADRDLVPLCREHHEAIHQQLDSHRYDYWGWDRRRATVVILSSMKKTYEKNKR